MPRVKDGLINDRMNAREEIHLPFPFPHIFSQDRIDESEIHLKSFL